MLQILKNKQKAREITNELLGYYVLNRTISPELYSSLVNRMSKELRIDRDDLWHCGRILIGTDLQTNLFQFVYFALVNKKALSDGICILGDDFLRPDTMIVRFAPPRHIADGLVSAPFNILSGCYAGKAVSVHFRPGVLWSGLYKIGYVRNSKKYWVDGLIESLSGMYAKLNMTPNGQSLADCCYEFVETSSISSYNQKNIISYRHGIRECPHGFEEEQITEENYCSSLCPKSWDFCPASGHPYECEDGNCNRCGGIGLFPVGSDCCLRCVIEREYADV